MRRAKRSQAAFLAVLVTVGIGWFERNVIATSVTPRALLWQTGGSDC